MECPFRYNITACDYDWNDSDGDVQGIPSAYTGREPVCCERIF